MHRRRSRRDNLTRQLSFETLEVRWALAPVTVSNASDVVNGDWTSGIATLISNPGPDGISLREAVLAANSGQGDDVITFSTNPAHGLSGATIQLTLTSGGELSITDSVMIDASMLSSLSIHAATNNRIFNINGGGNVTLSNLTLTGGNTSGEGGAIRANNASLTVQHSTITNRVQFSMRSCAITALAV